MSLGDDLEEVIAFLFELGFTIFTERLDKKYPMVINNKDLSAFPLGTNALMACLSSCGGKQINVKTLKTLVVNSRFNQVIYHRKLIIYML
ncbi:hypothetical protein BN85315330 [Paracholeplasma brassicae]|uniref:Uncharacterized protein n=1 Tax=Acholeplasma brassicae TaxID=61635 RepID=U4KTE6_9MOLU|nr:hypothetical protein [Paracholeplasma brassicae]CCV66554.1 hypothetical protein BN85315330 [Paracholeplasma brassicae]